MAITTNIPHPDHGPNFNDEDYPTARYPYGQPGPGKTAECGVLPVPVKDATIEQQIETHNDRRTHMLCRIQSAQRVMLELGIELAKDSPNAGEQCRNMVRKFRELEMSYLEDSRRQLAELLEKRNLLDNGDSVANPPNPIDKLTSELDTALAPFYPRNMGYPEQK